MRWEKKYKLPVIGILLGALAGWFYYYWFGCEGGCAITSSPVNSSVYGAAMGGLFINAFKKEEKNTNSNNQNNGKY